MVKVLVVEDDPAIVDAVVYALRLEGMVVQSTGSVEAARAQLAGRHLVILDLMLSDGSGFSVLETARSMTEPPRVILLTSRDEETDVVAGLEAGADDYVVKPFSLRALVARARAVLRRGGACVRRADDGRRRVHRPHAGYGALSSTRRRSVATVQSRATRSNQNSGQMSVAVLGV